MAVSKTFRPKKNAADALELAAFKDKFFKERAGLKGRGVYDVHESIISGVSGYRKNAGMLINNRGVRSGKNDVYGYFGYLPELKQRIEARLEECKRTGAPVRILDVGCGAGSALKKLKHKYGRRLEVHGCDLLAKKKVGMIGAVRAGVQFTRSEASLLPYDRNKFDIVLSVYGLDHFPNKLETLREMVRVAKEGSEGEKSGEVMVHSEDLRKIMVDDNYEPIDLVEELRNVGLDVKQVLSAGRGSNFMRNIEVPLGLRAKLRKMSLEAMRAHSMDTYHHVLCIRKNEGDEVRLRDMPLEYAGAGVYRRKQPLRVSAP